MSKAQIVLLVYVILLFLGGLMGFIKAKSKASLIASSIFGAVLLLFVFNVLPFKHHVWVLGFLAVFFGKRYVASRKFMPSGLMMFLSVAAAIAINLLQ